MTKISLHTKKSILKQFYRNTITNLKFNLFVFFIENMHYAVKHDALSVRSHRSVRGSSPGKIMQFGAF